MPDWNCQRGDGGGGSWDGWNVRASLAHSIAPRLVPVPCSGTGDRSSGPACCVAGRSTTTPSIVARRFATTGIRRTSTTTMVFVRRGLLDFFHARICLFKDWQSAGCAACSPRPGEAQTGIRGRPSRVGPIQRRPAVAGSTGRTSRRVISQPDPCGLESAGRECP